MSIQVPKQQKQKEKIQEILHSHVFQEDIERVFECFDNRRILTEITYKDIISNNTELSIEEESKSIDNNSNSNSNHTKILLEWKNTFKFEMSEKVINTPTYKSLIHNMYLFEPIKGEFTIIYNFYWNSCEKSTLLTIESQVEQFYFQLIEQEFPLKDRLTICSNVSNYLKTMTKNLIKIESIEIKHPMLQVWAFVSKFSNLAILMSYQSAIVEVDPGINSYSSLQSLGKSIKIYKNSEDKRLIAIISVNKLSMSQDKIEILFDCREKENGVPRQIIKLMLVMLDMDSCLFFIKHISLDHISSVALNEIAKTKRKMLKEMKDHLEGY